MAKANDPAVPTRGAWCVRWQLRCSTRPTPSRKSQNCVALANTLRNLERSGDFGDLQDTNDRMRQAQQDRATGREPLRPRWLQCDAKAGRPLDAQCRAEAKQVLAARAALKRSSSEADTGKRGGAAA